MAGSCPEYSFFIFASCEPLRIKMLIHKGTQSMKYSQDKSTVYKLNVGEQYNRDSKKRYTRTSRPKKRKKTYRYSVANLH